MEASTLVVSIEGLELGDWAPAFRGHLASLAGGESLEVEAAARAGGLGARRSPAVRVGPKADAAQRNTLQVLGLVLSALSLTVAAVQLGRDLEKPALAAPPAPPPPFECRIEGPNGVHELRIAGIPSEAVLRKCLELTGPPTRVKVIPPKAR